MLGLCAGCRSFDNERLEVKKQKRQDKLAAKQVRKVLGTET